MRNIAVLREQSELHVLPRRQRHERSMPPPSARNNPPSLPQRGQPQTRMRHHNENCPAHETRLKSDSDSAGPDSNPGFFGQTEDHLTDDVALDLR